MVISAPTRNSYIDNSEILGITSRDSPTPGVDRTEEAELKLVLSQQAYDDFLWQQLPKQILKVTLDLIAKSEAEKKPWHVILRQSFRKIGILRIFLWKQSK